MEFTRWPGYDQNVEVVGVYSSLDKAKEAAPFSMDWNRVSDLYQTVRATDPNGDDWFVYSMVLDAPIEADYPTWEINDDRR